MTLRMALGAAAVLSLVMFAEADPPKPEGKGGEQKQVSDVDRRLSELEAHVASLLKEVQALRAESKSLASKNVKAEDVKVFALKNADAAGMAKMLKQLLQGPDAKSLSIAVDERTNSVLVRGGSEHLEVIEAIIIRLEEKGAKNGKTDEKSKTKDAEKKKGSFSDLDDLKSRFKDLDFDVQKLQERADWLKRMGQKGYLSATQIELDMKSLEKARDEIQKARDQLLKQFDKPKQPADNDKKPQNEKAKDPETKKEGVSDLDDLLSRLKDLDVDVQKLLRIEIQKAELIRSREKEKIDKQKTPPEKKAQK